MRQLRHPFLLFFAFILVLCAWTVLGDDPGALKENHNPYTFQGLRLRANMAVPVPDGWGGTKMMDMGPALFQEIAPCQLISTLEADHYPAPWGGPAFDVNETRVYYPAGELTAGTWVNPCFGKVPSGAMAVALRVRLTGGTDDGIVYIAPAAWGPKAGAPIFAFQKNDLAIEEISMMVRGGGFSLTTADAGADLVVDVTGYYLLDPNGSGPKGEKGEPGEIGAQGPMGPAGPSGAPGPNGEMGLPGLQGEAGPMGPQGTTGPQGPIGPMGEKGEIGLQGERGLQGEIGLTGPQGATGPQGPTGPMGDKGDTGLQGPMGLQGPQGETGLQGATGPQGPVGPMGDKGDTGLQGPMGLQGPQGDTGLQGATGPQGPMGEKGDKGDIGPQGLQGETGPAGPQGQQGVQGPPGPIGPQGPKGDIGVGITFLSGVETFPPGGTIRIYNSSIQSSSLITVNYVGGSKGNACSVDDQGDGWADISGSPNKQFRYVVFD